VKKGKQRGGTEQREVRGQSTGLKWEDGRGHPCVGKSEIQDRWNCSGEVTSWCLYVICCAESSAGGAVDGHSGDVTPGRASQPSVRGGSDHIPLVSRLRTPVLRCKTGTSKK